MEMSSNPREKKEALDVHRKQMSRIYFIMMAVINPAWEENSLTRQTRLSIHGGLPLMTQPLPQWRQKHIQILTQSQQCHSKRYPGAGLYLQASQGAWIYPAP